MGKDEKEENAPVGCGCERCKAVGKALEGVLDEMEKAVEAIGDMSEEHNSIATDMVFAISACSAVLEGIASVSGSGLDQARIATSGLLEKLRVTSELMSARAGFMSAMDEMMGGLMGGGPRMFSMSVPREVAEQIGIAPPKPDKNNIH